MNNVYGINIIPENDAQRVAALERYRIFNTGREKAFDSLCELAASIFQCPMAHISFLNEETEFVKANHGIGDIVSVERGVGMCALTVMQGEELIIENTLQNPLLDRHPYVHGDFGLRFYAAVPLITPDNYIIGTFCVLDTKPRAITDHERQILRNLGKVAMEQTENRLAILMEDEFKAQLLRHQDEFISLASHELKTPVTSLKAAVQLIDRLKENYPQDTALSKMVGQADRSLTKLVGLVNNLLDVGRIATGKLLLQKKTFSVEELVGRCCSNLKDNAANQHISYEGPAKLEAFADEERIQQVIGHLINNAVKYSNGRGNININAEQKGNMITITVADNGPGIPPDRISGIFERYNALDESGVKLSGLGLSLYISAGILHAHGGEIGVNSQPGEGASFWFTLPVAENTFYSPAR